MEKCVIYYKQEIREGFEISFLFHYNSPPKTKRSDEKNSQLLIVFAFLIFIHFDLILIKQYKLILLVIFAKYCANNQLKCMKIEFLIKKYRQNVVFLLKCILKWVYYPLIYLIPQ